MMWERALLCVLVLLVAMTGKAENTDLEINIQLDLLNLNFTPVWIENGDNMFSDEQRKQIFEAAENCIELYSTIPKPIGDAEYCPFTFDGWKCWNYTKSGTTAEQNCPSYVPSSHKGRKATKVCNEDGTWYEINNNTWTNYTDCMAPLVSIGYTNVYYVGYTLSVLSCCIALFIFCYFKSLACPRVTMHKNLFLAFILHGVTYIIYNAAIAANSNVLDRDSFDCRLMLMMWQYFQMCSYFWMLCEGIYLHRVVVVAVMSNQNAVWWYYVIGWALPLLFIVVSALCKTFLYDKLGASDNNVCWTIPSSLDWILAVPMIAVLVVNFLMLLNILRVLVSKLQHTHNSANSSYKRAARATLILVPLLGLHYIIMPMRIKNGVFYSYFMAVCLSIQGFFVACIFCFFNAEVKAQIIRRWFNYTVNRKSRRSKYTRNSTLTHTSMTEYSNTTPQNARRRDMNNYVLQEHSRPNGSLENSPHLSNGPMVLKDANSNTQVEKPPEVNTPLIDRNLLNTVEPDKENEFKIGHVTLLDSGYCDVQIDTAV